MCIIYPSEAASLQIVITVNGRWSFWSAAATSRGRTRLKSKQPLFERLWVGIPGSAEYLNGCPGVWDWSLICTSWVTNVSFDSLKEPSGHKVWIMEVQVKRDFTTTTPEIRGRDLHKPLPYSAACSCTPSRVCSWLWFAGPLKKNKRLWGIQRGHVWNKVWRGYDSLMQPWIDNSLLYDIILTATFTYFTILRGGFRHHRKHEEIRQSFSTIYEPKEELLRLSVGVYLPYQRRI